MKTPALILPFVGLSSHRCSQRTGSRFFHLWHKQVNADAGVSRKHVVGPTPCLIVALPTRLCESLAQSDAPSDFQYAANMTGQVEHLDKRQWRCMERSR
jgi:hypothetical protein